MAHEVVINDQAGAMSWRVQSRRKDKKQGWTWNVGIGGKPGREPYATGGWSVVQPDHYDKNPTKPEMVQVTLYNNRKSYVPISDVDEFMRFNKLEANQVSAEMADYVNKAWAVQSGSGRYYEFDGPSKCHIAHVKYNPTFQVMEVEFDDGRNGSGSGSATVTFFRVPKELYLEFAMHAKNGTTRMGTDGKNRHLLGIRFWDLVRIRGSRTGGRYPYVYSTGGVHAGNPGYADSALNAYSPQVQQSVDAEREAFIDNTEQPVAAEKKEIADQQWAKDLAAQIKSGKLSTGQKNAIERMRDKIEEKYGGVDTPQYRDFSNAVLSGWGAINQVANKYKLWG